MPTSRSLIETLCRCQSLVSARGFDLDKNKLDIDNLQVLINMLEGRNKNEVQN
jgi:hypothetical protein